jgi:FtsP/CotA-like multicopper oxidase with cupredoxin domain
MTGRRDFLKAAGTALIAPAAFEAISSPAPATRRFELVAAEGQAALVGAPQPDTAVWCFNGRVPGTELRLAQGERVRIEVVNRLAESTTVHWHGVRVPNAMDGVPGLTQDPIAPGGRFVYEFDALDAGTFWYHPHSRAYEQVERGLAGAFIVEEREAPEADRDVTWVLDDWRLTRAAGVSDDFLSPFDTTHAGRLGNTVTVNGAIAERFELRAGERVRLRLVNVANARTFGLQFAGHRPWIVAYDGHPVEPHQPARGTVVIGASQRVDLLLDAVGAPGSSHVVRDVYYPRQAYRLLDLAYRDEEALRSEARAAPRALPPNPLPEPVLEGAAAHEVRITGGAMSANLPQPSFAERAARELRRMLGSHEPDPAWALNGVAITGEHTHAPILTVKRGATVVIDFRNETMWPHPMHLHGHAFRVVERNGRPNPLREWRDTVLLERRESARIAFVADNPGDWMLHCHVLEHQAAGMMATFRVD